MNDFVGIDSPHGKAQLGAMTNSGMAPSGHTLGLVAPSQRRQELPDSYKMLRNPDEVTIIQYLAAIDRKIDRLIERIG